MSNLIRVGKQLHPITHDFVIRPNRDLSQYTGLIHEYYNRMPVLWSEAYGMSTAMWVRIACAYINFITVTHDFGGGFLWTEQDEFGLVFQRVNGIGENTVYGGPMTGWTWEQRMQYDLANGGGLGAVVSAATPYQFGWHSAQGFTPNANQPQVFVGANCEFAELYSSDTSSGADNTWEFGWLGQVFVGNTVHESFRTKDFVVWLYEFSYDTGVWTGSLDTEGVPDDRLFLPGQRGIRRISNHYKYAPWERYPHLL